MVGVGFTMGQRFGKVQQELAAVKERLGRIEAMFELRLRQEQNKNS